VRYTCPNEAKKSRWQRRSVRKNGARNSLPKEPPPGQAWTSHIAVAKQASTDPRRAMQVNARCIMFSNGPHEDPSAQRDLRRIQANQNHFLVRRQRWRKRQGRAEGRQREGRRRARSCNLKQPQLKSTRAHSGLSSQVIVTSPISALSSACSSRAAVRYRSTETQCLETLLDVRGSAPGWA
jgi:hypothetical protein